MALKKTGEPNYLLLGLGGMFLVAIIVILAYSFAAAPLSGCVGVVEIKGPIISDDIGSTIFSDEIKGAETIAEEIEAADERQDVKSVLILIDSPGGSVVASRRLYDAVNGLNKTTVSYINEMAASGGYYVAAGSDYIISNPDAITGSIGARATFSDMSGLFAKLGYNETVVKSGSMKDIGSSSRPMTDAELAVIQGIINESFGEFRAAVEEGRKGKLDSEGWKTALDARIMSGRQAKKIGLVDELGSRKQAIAKAGELGGIKGEPRLCRLSGAPSAKGLFGSLSLQAVEFLARGAAAPRLSYQ